MPPARVALVLFLAAATAGCDLLRRELSVPGAAEAASYYESQRAVESVEVSGNVVELRVRQDPAQLRRGGSLWAKVGPYVYAFSPNTRDMLDAYPGIAAVRVTTFVDPDTEVTRVMLHRDTMNDILWRRSLNILGHALQEGTRRPTRLQELVVWGERYTDVWYNPEFVPEARTAGNPD